MPPPGSQGPSGPGSPGEGGRAYVTLRVNIPVEESACRLTVAQPPPPVDNEPTRPELTSRGSTNLRCPCPLPAPTVPAPRRQYR